MQSLSGLNRKLESHVKGAMFEDSVKFKLCFVSETKLYFHFKGALFADNAKPQFHVKEARFPSSGKKSFMFKKACLPVGQNFIFMLYLLSPGFLKSVKPGGGAESTHTL